MTYDKIPPEVPIRAPTVVRSSFCNMNPSAASAQPEYEFSTVITTGTSPPPIDAVVCAPRANERAVFNAKQDTFFKKNK